MRAARTLTLAAGLSLCSGCVLIDDFDAFTFTADVGVSGADVGGADAAVTDASSAPDQGVTADAGAVDAGATADGGVTDGGVVVDGGVADGGAAVDAGPADVGSTRTCTDPCVADAVLDFSRSAQPAGAAAWRYEKDTREANGLGFVPLAPNRTWAGLTGTWADGSPPPALLSCREHAGEAPCAGLPDSLLMVADAPGASGGGDPALSFEATDATTLQLDALYRGADGISSTNAFELVVSRNSRLDVIRRLTGLPSTTANLLSTPVDVLPGDRIFFTLRPTDSAMGTDPLGVDYRVSRYLDDVPLADCQFAVNFDGANPFVDHCGGVTLENGTQGSGSTPSTEVPGPSSWMGTGRDLDHGSVIRASGARFDYSGDFTVQMWVRIDSNNYWDTAIYSDWSAYDPMTAGGVALELDPEGPTGTVTAGFLFPDPGNTPSHPAISCDGGSCSGEIVGTLPAGRDWHFYRLVRDTQLQELRFCIDGVLQGGAPLDNSIDISNPRSPAIGSWEILRDPTFDGDVDDLRIFKRKLPCG